MLMLDVEKNQKPFPQQKNQKPGLGFPITRLVGLIFLSTRNMINYVKALSTIWHSIASTMIRQRKRKPQPRHVKLRRKPYPLLKEAREIAAQKLQTAMN